MFAALALALLFVVPAALAQITVATPPSVVVCEPVSLSWTGGVSPYYVSIIPGGQAGATAIESFPTQPGNSYVWNVNLPATSYITIQVRDTSGNIQYSSPITVQAGPDTSCLNASVSGVTSGGAAAPTSAGTPASASASASVSMPAGSSAGGVSQTSSHSSTSAGSATKASTSPSSAPSSGASSFQVGAFSVAGVAGLIGALLF